MEGVGGMRYFVYMKRICDECFNCYGSFTGKTQAERCIEDMTMKCGVDYVDYYIKEVERGGIYAD